ncbi:MAG: sensor histidine kinase [Terriglobia bacterium]
MRVPPIGLQAKIITFAAFLCITVVGISTYIASLLTRSIVEEEIYVKGLAIARSTARELVGREGLESPSTLLQTLRQVEKDFPSVQRADVFSHAPEHRLVSSLGYGGEPQELDNLPGIEGYYEFERPDSDTLTIETPDGKSWVMATTIRDEGRAIGCLNLTVSKSHTSRLTRELVMRNLGLMVASLCLVFVVIHLFFLKRVRGPMREMIRVMEGAESGQLNMRARVSSDDEIGQLAEHLNRMLARIENFNAELGRRVEEATTELAHRNEELAKINEELFETQKILARSERLAVAGQLAASLAHEIGTPLNSISGHVQLLGRRSPNDEASSRRLRIIERQIEQIVRTVKQLLSWTHTLELHAEPVDIRQVAKEALLLSSPALKLRGIRVRTEIPSDLPEIYGDFGYLQQVFLNLINNSMDAMPGGGELRVRLRAARDERGSNNVVFEIEDTGQGMTAETLNRVFEPMFTTKRMGTGAGLGLAICDQVVRQHAGTIQVESEPGRGTRFIITLPLDFREKGESVAGTVSTIHPVA